MKIITPLITLVLIALSLTGCRSISDEQSSIKQSTDAEGIEKQLTDEPSAGKQGYVEQGNVELGGVEQGDVEQGAWYRPSPLITWHIQLSGSVNTSHDAELYDIDLFDSSATLIQELQGSGIKVICYFSAGSYEEWRSDASSFKASDLGNTLDGWPGEKWLDIRSENVRSIMKSRLDLAKSKGCDGVDPDNMDGYTNKPGMNLTAKDQLEYNRFIANEAHARMLAVGLKNDIDQIKELVTYFDFAVNEQCFEYSECSTVESFIAANKPVFNIEYQQKYVNRPLTLEALCSDSINKQFSTLALPLELNDEFRLSCQ